MKILLGLIVLLFITGCGTIQPAITEYRMKVPHTGDKSLSKNCKEKSIKIASAFSSSNLVSLDMNYVTDEYQQFKYSQSAWAISPNDAISAEFLNLFKQIDIFKNVQISKSKTQNDFILEISIDEFMQFFDKENKKSYAEIKISLSIVDAKTYENIASKSFYAKVDAKTLDAMGGVKALSKAMENILKDSTKWINGVCK